MMAIGIPVTVDGRRRQVPGVPEIDEEKCTGCGDCVDSCPTGAAELVDGHASIARPNDCDYCTECEVLCPSDAITCPFEIVLGDGDRTD
jgi:MinD superfamily P-loop ATPase